MSSGKSNLFSREVCAFIRQLLGEPEFYAALCQSVREYKKMYFTSPRDKMKTVSIHWISALALLRLIGDTLDGGEEPETQFESKMIRHSLMNQLRHISPPHSADGFVVRFLAMSVQMRIRVSHYDAGTGRWDMRISVEDFSP